MSRGSMCDAQVLFLCDLSESVLSLPQVFSFYRVPFDGTSFLGMSSDILAALSPWSFPCFNECFPLLKGLFVLGLASLAPVGGFSVTICVLQRGLTMGLVGGGTSGDFSWDFIFFFFLGQFLPLPAVTSLDGPAASSPTFLGPTGFVFSPLQCLKWEDICCSDTVTLSRHSCSCTLHHSGHRLYDSYRFCCCCLHTGRRGRRIGTYCPSFPYLQAGGDGGWFCCVDPTTGTPQ